MDRSEIGQQAWIKSVKVELPKNLPSRLTTLQKACTAKAFETKVPFAGKLVATGKGLSKASKSATKATTLTVKLHLTNGEAAFLGKHKGRKLAAKVKLTFTPKKGAKLKTSTTVLIG